MSDSARQTAMFASWWARDVVESEHCTLSRNARALLMLLAAHVNAAHYANPSRELLGRGLAGLDRRGVMRARAELEAAGLIQVFAGGQGPRTTNGYWLAVRGLTPQAAADAKGGISAPVSYPQGGRGRPRSNGRLVHKGGTDDAKRGAPTPPEVDSEVSRKRARVSSPPLLADVDQVHAAEDELWDFR